MASEKVQVLTTTEKLEHKTETEVQSFNLPGQESKEASRRKHILSTSNSRTGSTLSNSTVDEIKLFYST